MASTPIPSEISKEPPKIPTDDSGVPYPQPAYDEEGYILVMGSPWAGKTSFIGVASGSRLPERSSLTLSNVEISEPFMMSGRKLRLIDIPGFDEENPTDADVLGIIADFLAKENRREIKQRFFGIIFLHDINAPGPAVGWAAQRRSRALISQYRMLGLTKNVVVVTTFWEQLASLDEGVANEGKLQTESGLLKGLRDSGSRFARHGHFEPADQPKGDEFLTPHEIVDHLLMLGPIAVDTQMGMADWSVGWIAAPTMGPPLSAHHLAQVPSPIATSYSRSSIRSSRSSRGRRSRSRSRSREGRPPHQHPAQPQPPITVKTWRPRWRWLRQKPPIVLERPPRRSSRGRSRSRSRSRGRGRSRGRSRSRSRSPQQQQPPTIVIQPSQVPPTVYPPPQAVPIVVPGMLPVGPVMMQQPPLAIQRSHSSSPRSVHQALPAAGATILPPRQQPNMPPTTMPPTIIQGGRSHSRESLRSHRSRSPRRVQGVPGQVPTIVVRSVPDSSTPDTLEEPMNLGRSTLVVTDGLPEVTTATAISESICFYPSGIIESRLESHEDQCLYSTGDRDLDRFFGLSCNAFVAEEESNSVFKEASCVEISGGVFNNAGNDIHNYMTDHQVHYYPSPLPSCPEQKGPGKDSKKDWPVVLLHGSEDSEG
ncbi:hypothetical protein BKA70DRAFT_1436102 [Coprinopsis sp. MPI-PUGE-AT-0042]|nr:hypothetical protein BKA70DRAFT_1436102 [Coprinopsis sp. MPI-PUGE-AT-0042]